MRVLEHPGLPVSRGEMSEGTLRAEDCVIGELSGSENLEEIVDFCQ